MKRKNLKSLTNEQRVNFVADYVSSFGSEVVIDKYGFMVDFVLENIFSDVLDKIYFLRSSGLSVAFFPLHVIDKPDRIHIVVNCYDTPYC